MIHFEIIAIVYGKMKQMITITCRKIMCTDAMGSFGITVTKFLEFYGTFFTTDYRTNFTSFYQIWISNLDAIHVPFYQVHSLEALKNQL